MKLAEHLCYGAVTLVAFVVVAGATAPRGSSTPCCGAAASTPRYETPTEHEQHVKRARLDRLLRERHAATYLVGAK